MPACPDQPASVRQGSAPALHGSVYYHTEPMDETAFPDAVVRSNIFDGRAVQMQLREVLYRVGHNKFTM